MGFPVRTHAMRVNIDGDMRNISNSLYTVGEGDKSGDIFAVDIFSDQEPANLDGCSCIGLMIRSDGYTVIITGQISGNRASVQLPESCYIQPGHFKLTLKISGSSMENSIFIFEGDVLQTTTESLVDPGNVIPSIADLTALAEQAAAAADEIEALSIESLQIKGTRYKIAVSIES